MILVELFKESVGMSMVKYRLDLLGCGGIAREDPDRAADGARAAGHNCPHR